MDEEAMTMGDPPIEASIAPWMAVRDGAAFWVQEDVDGSPKPGGARPIRIILSVDDPDALFDRAVAAGAKQVAPVAEVHGWRTGRVTDPFGHDWEFARPVTT
jgi:PhnB protein